ncbi:hypothetical protein [Nitratireductor sp. GZWM139]|uniref:hypothetical protein n=1 Tax=Nitratireductor sp. GZWM139 TaxID=2950541 RepID=UPI0024BE33C3|nr:hypothetical protein [Nitratireductor sp. GZWM139]MDJ1465972.1 hypothetical protein [Nitratireductor sp. GZWM139]
MTSVETEKTGYARGLILGLTMAETMLLLVFCLLLVAGAMLAEKQRELDKALAKNDVLQATVNEQAATISDIEKDKEKLVAELSRLMMSSNRKLAEEDWRELIIAKDAADKIRAAGISLQEAVERIEDTKAVIAYELAATDIERLVSADERASAAEERARQEEMRRIEAERIIAETSSGKPHEWPPIIDLSEAEGYSFETGSADLKGGFRSKLEGEIAQRIASIVAQYGVDVVEVIGHTDEQRLSRKSNIDQVLGEVLSGAADINIMEPGDNAGLGLARAISVAAVLKALPNMQGVEILPLSGAQLILPSDTMTDGAQSGDAPKRRRIEIRVRKSKQQLRSQ